MWNVPPCHRCGPRRSWKRTRQTTSPWCGSPRNASSALATNPNLTEGGRLSMFGPTRWWMRWRDTWSGSQQVIRSCVRIRRARQRDWFCQGQWLSRIIPRRCARSSCVCRFFPPGSCRLSIILRFVDSQYIVCMACVFGNLAYVSSINIAFFQSLIKSGLSGRIHLIPELKLHVILQAICFLGYYLQVCSIPGERSYQ